MMAVEESNTMMIIGIIIALIAVAVTVALLYFKGALGKSVPKRDSIIIAGTKLQDCYSDGHLHLRLVVCAYILGRYISPLVFQLCNFLQTRKFCCVIVFL